MIKKTALLLTLLIHSIAYPYETQTGTIFTENGEKLEVELRVYETDIILSYKKIAYFDNDKKKKIGLSQIKKIEIANKTYEVITSQKKITSGPNRGTNTYRHLAELIVDGEINLYREYKIETNGGYMSGAIYYATNTYLNQKDYLMKKSEYASLVTKINLKKKINQFFPECKLLEGLGRDEMKFIDLKQVVISGNDKCY